MVPMRSLQDDFYYLDEDNFKIVGQRRGKQFRLGDAVMIKVKHIDLARKQMDFELVE
jgi:ribonuclease R